MDGSAVVSVQVLERRRSEFLMPRKTGGSPFVGRDLVLGRTRRVVTHLPADSEPLKTKKQIAGVPTSPIHAGTSPARTSSGEPDSKSSVADAELSEFLASTSTSGPGLPAGSGTVPGETWELSVVEVGHLSSTQVRFIVAARLCRVLPFSGSRGLLQPLYWLSASRCFSVAFLLLFCCFSALLPCFRVWVHPVRSRLCLCLCLCVVLPPACLRTI